MLFLVTMKSIKNNRINFNIFLLLFLITLIVFAFLYIHTSKTPTFLVSHIDGFISPGTRVYSFNKQMYAYEEPPGGCGKFSIVDIQKKQIVKTTEVSNHLIKHSESNFPKAIAWSQDNKKIVIVYHYNFKWLWDKYKNKTKKMFNQLQNCSEFSLRMNRFQNYTLNKNINTINREIRGHAVVINLYKNRITYFQINKYFHKVLFCTNKPGLIFEKPDNRKKIFFINNE